jgi:hypothetical protein
LPPAPTRRIDPWLTDVEHDAEVDARHRPPRWLDRKRIPRW